MKLHLFKRNPVAAAASTSAALALLALGAALSASAHAQTYQFRKVAPGLVAAPEPASAAVTAPETPPAPAPTYVLEASSAIVSFGQTALGQTSVRSVELLNQGTGVLELGQVSTTGAGFGVETNCATTLAAGTSCQAQVAFTPMAPGPYSGELVVTSNATAGTLGLSLTGTGMVNAALISPSYSLFYEGKHPAWMETGHAWTWATSGYVSNAAGGTINVQGLLTNATSVARTVTLYYSVDDAMPSIKLNNIEVSRPACGGHTNLCTVNLSLPPGTSLLTMTPQNGSGPAGFSSWVMDSGTVLLSTTNTSGPKAWTRF